MLLTKTILWSAAALLSTVVLWFAANRLLDEAVDPQRAAFLQSMRDQVPDELNIAVAILGLTAPPGEDFVRYGSKIKALYEHNAPWGEVEQLLQGSTSLLPTVEGGEVTCWLDPDWPPMDGCLAFKEAPKVLEQNKNLLDRYKALHKMGGYANLGMPLNQAYLVVLRLSVADMHLDLRSRRYEAAYRKWREQMLFLRANLYGPDTWVGKSVGLVALGMTLPFVESLLLARPRMADDHAEEFLEAVWPEGMKAFNPEGLMRAEYWLLQKALEDPPPLSQNSRILNRYYRFAGDYAAALHLPWDEFDRATERLRKTHVLASRWDMAIDPFGSLFLGEHIESMLKTRELVRQMHLTDGRLRLAALLVRIINDRVSDAEMPAYLASAGKEFLDPFTHAPMRWDPNDRKIYFPDPEHRCTVAAYMRIPDLRRTGKASSPVVDTQAC